MKMLRFGVIFCYLMKFSWFWVFLSRDSTKFCKGNLDQKKWLYFFYYLLAPKGSHKKCPTDLKFVATLLKSGPCFIFVTPFGTHSVIDNDKVIFFCTCWLCKLFRSVSKPSVYNQVLFHKTCENMVWLWMCY